MDLQGSTVLVTGSNRGIGRAIADELTERGATVLAGVRALDSSHEVGAPGPRRVRMDLSTPEAIESSVEELDDERIDILVNNAGVFLGGLFETQEVGRIYELLQVNLAGAIHLTRLILPQMLERGSGKLVMNTSIIAHARFPGATTYAASKSGLVGFTESLRRELDATEVSVLELVTPGVDTDMMDQVQAELDEHSDTSNWDHVNPDDWAEKVVKAIENEDDELKPGGGERLAQIIPKSILDVAAKRGFER